MTATEDCSRSQQNARASPATYVHSSGTSLPRRALHLHALDLSSSWEPRRASAPQRNNSLSSLPVVTGSLFNPSNLLLPIYPSFSIATKALQL
ncbi:hypothetical protein CMUS01_02148 [Colletotrichum musicola]|uniref:Uncharacterized protein n=1 Tax=Colletotrichum musicola TaxID=2175873 RepID=A0A8H6U7B5_9PEZI|nr:hypothetical protein CMUS01_02148 [Colletotrichum musicola]